MPLTDEDRRRLYESRHDLDAASNPARLTDHPAFLPALAASHGALQSSRDGLKAAAALVVQEKGETDAERVKLQQALAQARLRYGFIRAKVQDALLNIDPDAPIATSEIDRRSKLFQRIFRVAPSDLERVSQGALIEILGSVAGALASEPDLAPLGHAQALAAQHAAAVTAAGDLDRETDEDAQAMVGLRAAREAFDRAAEAHALLVESVLVRAGRAQDLGRFVLARDPAYAARRAARAPLGDEPDIGGVDAEPPPAAR